MLEYIKENKKNVLIVSVFILVVIVLTIVVNLLNKDTNQVLTNAYVKNLTKNDLESITDCDLDEVLKTSKVPYFNISNTFYDNMNDEILYEFLLRACYQEGIVNYEDSINNDILSVAINISYESVNDLTYVEYKTYNIDIKNNKILDNATLLNKYKVTLEEASTIVTSKLMEYYNYELDHNYIEKNVSFNEYLKILEFEPLTNDNLKLYIDKNNALWLYKEYSLSEAMMRYEDYPVITIRFRLT